MTDRRPSAADLTAVVVGGCVGTGLAAIGWWTFLYRQWRKACS